MIRNLSIRALIGIDDKSGWALYKVVVRYILRFGKLTKRKVLSEYKTGMKFPRTTRGRMKEERLSNMR